MFDNNKLATKGDVNRGVQKHVQNVQDNIQHQINNVYNNMASHMNYIREESNQKMNQLNQNLAEQSKKFEELEKKLNNPLANQANELRSRAIESFNNGWLKEAKEEIVKALELNNKDFVSHLIFARIYKKEGKVDKAIEHYDLAIKYSKPYDKEFWKSTGSEKALFYVELAEKEHTSNFEEAIKYYDLALSTANEFDFYVFQEITIFKTKIYVERGLLEEALEILNSLGNRNLLSDVYYFKAILLIQIGKIDESYNNALLYIKNTLDFDKIFNEPLFIPIKEKIENWEKENIDPLYSENDNLYDNIEETDNKIVEILNKINKDYKDNKSKDKDFENYSKRFLNLREEYNNLYKIYKNKITSFEQLKNLTNNLRDINQKLKDLYQDANNLLEKLKANSKKKIIFWLTTIIGIASYLYYEGFDTGNIITIFIIMLFLINFVRTLFIRGS